MPSPRASPASSGLTGPEELWRKALRTTVSSPADSLDIGIEDTVPTSFGGPQYATNVSTVSAKKYCVILVGLPARGKTFLAHKLCRLLGWLGHSAKVFNVQRVWRDILLGKDPMHCRHHSSVSEGFGGSLTKSPEHGPTREPSSETCFNQTNQQSPYSNSPRFGEFDFDSNPENAKRYVCALESVGTRLEKFFNEGGLVGFVNDDFCDPKLREEAERVVAPLCDEIIYIEVIRDDNAAFNTLKIQSAGEYYGDMDEKDAKADFLSRVDVLKKTYVQVGEDKRYIKITDGTKLEIHAVSGYIPSRMVSFLMNLSQKKVSYPIYFSRHGQTTYNVEDRLGGNPLLTKKGLQDAECLKEFIGVLKGAHEPGTEAMQIWTSQLTRTIQTARPSERAFDIKCLRWSSLNEIHAGVCEELTYADVKKNFPLIHDFRKKNKYAFRYPNGESYQDLVARLEPVIMELENANCVVVVVAHQAILRALLAYFNEASAESSVEVDVPHRTVWRCTSSSNGSSKLEEMSLSEWLESQNIPVPEVPQATLDEAEQMAKTHDPRLSKSGNSPVDLS